MSLSLPPVADTTSQEVAGLERKCSIGAQTAYMSRAVSLSDLLSAEVCVELSQSSHENRFRHCDVLIRSSSVFQVSRKVNKDSLLNVGILSSRNPFRRAPDHSNTDSPKVSLQTFHLLAFNDAVITCRLVEYEDEYYEDDRLSRCGNLTKETLQTRTTQLLPSQRRGRHLTLVIVFPAANATSCLGSVTTHRTKWGCLCRARASHFKMMMCQTPSQWRGGGRCENVIDSFLQGALGLPRDAPRRHPSRKF